MDEAFLSTGRDAFLVAVPLVLLQLIGLFRLDEIISKPKKTLKWRRPSCQMNEDREPVLSDPDGRLSRYHSPAGNHIGSCRQRSLVPEPTEPPREHKIPTGLYSHPIDYK